MSLKSTEVPVEVTGHESKWYQWDIPVLSFHHNELPVTHIEKEEHLILLKRGLSSDNDVINRQGR